MVFKEKYVDLDTGEITRYIKKKTIISWKDLEQRFNATKGAIKYRLRHHKLIYSLQNKGRYFTLYGTIKNDLDGEGLWRHDDLVFSKWGSIEPTLKQLITRSSGGCTGKDMRAKLNLGLHEQIRNLVKKKEVVRMKLGYEYLYFSRDDKIREQQIKTRQELSPDLDISTLKKEKSTFSALIDAKIQKPII